jgi:hypothetical protein
MNSVFTTPEKATADELGRQLDISSCDPVINGLLKSSSGILIVMNEKRQLLTANQILFDYLGISDPATLSGQRIGEVFGCIHARSMLGCGASPWCRTCGATATIINCLRDNEPANGDATISVNHLQGNLSRCFQIRCVPHYIDKNRVVLLTLNEITRWRNLETLERYFLSEFSRAVNAFDCQSRMARHSGYEDLPDILEDLEKRALLLSGDVRLHRFLLGHNSEKHSRKPGQITISEIIDLAINSISESPYIIGKKLECPRTVENKSIFIDWQVLVRVLQNMLLNAFEHTDQGRPVRLAVEEQNENELLFSVWNHKQIIEPMRIRVFQRHFSSRRDPGRGLGTYAIKLLSEEFLGGRVSFETSESGTNFRLSLPIL